MKTTYRRFSKRRAAELRGYVARGIVAFRALTFIGAVAAVAAVLRIVHRAFVLLAWM